MFVQMCTYMLVCACTELKRLYFSWHDRLILLYTKVRKKALVVLSLLPIAVAILLSCRVKIWGWEYVRTVLPIYTE